MALSDNQKKQVRTALHKAYSRYELPMPWTKPEIDAAITALDDFLANNKVAINNALPTAFKTSASAADKAVLFNVIAMADYIVGNSGHANALKDIARRAAEME